MNREQRRAQGPDTRYAYGAVCSWSGPIQEVSTTEPKSGVLGSSPVSIPCCPLCGGPLYEVDSKEQWDRQIAEFDADGHPGYIAFQEWIVQMVSAGECFTRADKLEVLNMYVANGGTEPPGLR